MSGSIGCVKLPHGLRWFVVNNNSDVGRSCLYESKKGMVKDWESGSLRRPVSCSHLLTTVQFYTEYGDGYYREGDLCTICGTITYSDEASYHPEDDFANSNEYRLTTVQL